MGRGADRLRALIAAEGIVVAPGAFDGLSARLVERSGFPVVYLTGGGVARSYGQPDIGAVSYVEMAERIRSVAAATSLPIIADLDAGHGGIATIRRAVREFELSGAAAVHIEDREVPRRFRDAAANLISPQEMAGRVKAALASRLNSAFCIIARTDALPSSGLDEAIDRANRYADAGADVIYVEHLKTIAEMENVARRVTAPKLISLNKGLGDTPPAADLAAMGYRILTLPADLQLAAIAAMQDILAHVARHGTTVGFDRMTSFPARDEIVGLQDARVFEDDYLPS